MEEGGKEDKKEDSGKEEEKKEEVRLKQFYINKADPNPLSLRWPSWHHSPAPQLLSPLPRTLASEGAFNLHGFHFT